ncbi:MAG: hypothetical protein LBH59_09230 [Planctomycetaceae bacterium]|jgi:hypothetical protein|nr:hypothetical protein [Planctomycetaceae bacterium]
MLNFRPLCPRYVYCMVAVFILVVMIVEKLFSFLLEESVSHYVIGFCVGVLLCEIANFLKWIWFRFLW